LPSIPDDLSSMLRFRNVNAVDELKEPAPLCFVLMPFGRKLDATGRLTDFDAGYRTVIAPAVERAGLDPVRADEERIGGTIHKPMFERLMLCHYAVADITGANPNVFYELGIRHALRPRSTVILFREGTVLPFDIVLVRGISYKTDGSGGPIQHSRVAHVAQSLAQAGARWVSTSVEPAMARGPDQVLVVRSEYRIATRNCPTYTPSGIWNPNESDMAGLGCADAYNMGQMLARPRDAAIGRPPGPADGQVNADAVQRYREGRVRAPAGATGGVTTGGGGGGAGGGGAGGPGI